MIKFYQTQVIKKSVYILFLGLLFALVPQKGAIAQGAGNTLSFDGTNEYVAITQNSGLPIFNNETNGNQYTVEFWVRGASGQSQARIFSEGNSSNDVPLFNILTGRTEDTATDRLDLYIRSDTQVLLDHTFSSRTVFDANWHHVAWSDDSGSGKLYIDGIEDDNSIGGSFNYNRSSSSSLNTTSLAALVRTSISNWFHGQIDELRIWSVIRTQSEIRDNMCRKLTGSEFNLVAYYRFDATSGSSLSDATGNINTGTRLAVKRRRFWSFTKTVV